MSRQRPLRAAAPALFLALAPALSGCALVAGAGVGYVVSQQVLGDVNVAQVRDDVDDVWASAQETLGFMIEPGTQMEIQDFPRIAKAKVNGAAVTVEVEAYDIDRTIIRVTAEKYLATDGRVASEVMTAILDRLPGS